MAEIQWTPEQIARIQRQVGLGVKRVKYGDKETEFISIDDALKLLSQMQNSITPKSTIRQRKTQGVFFNGFNNC